MQSDLKMFTIEYNLAAGFRFDGVTPAPPFSTDPTSILYKQPSDDQIFRFELEQNVGIIDPDFGIGGSEGDRFIQLLDIELPINDFLTVAVTDFQTMAEAGGIPQQSILPQTELLRYYRDSCIFVPQGSVLAILSPADGGISKLRYNVVTPESRAALAQMLQECCCLEDSIEPNVCNPPILTRLDSNEFQFDPAYLVANASGQQVLLRGVDLSAADSYEFVGPSPVPVVTNVTEVAGAMLIDYDSGDLPGNSTYDLQVCRDGQPGCCSTLEDAAFYFSCLGFTRVDPDQATVDTGAVNMTILGANFVTIGVDSVSISQSGTDIVVPASLSVVDDQEINFQVQTNGAPLGSYGVVITPSDPSCPDIVIPNGFEIVA